MTKELVKEGVQLAEKELREQQVSEVKKIVLKTLEKIQEKTKARDKLSEEIKLLRLDISDLKEGRLDRISERQEKDEKAKETSVVVIIREKEIVREVSPWYLPYQITWNQPVYVNPTPIFYSGGSMTGLAIGSSDNKCCTSINCSVAKDATIGAYNVQGEMIHLR